MALLTLQAKRVIRRMTQNDIPAGQELTAAAGWNQTAHDWRVLLELEPDGAWVCELDGQIVGSTTAICYGRELAWIGMVLVAPHARRQGVARDLLMHALNWLRQQEIGVAKLDATDLGVPLYERLGFRDECIVERWALVRDDPAAKSMRTAASFEDEDIETFDREAFGCSRLQLLGQLAALPGATSWARANGYALTRPGAEATYLGPCIAKDPETAKDLISNGIGSCTGRLIYWDLPTENAAATALAAGLGFDMKRRLRRMALRLADRSAAPTPQYEMQFALAGFEFG